MDQPRHRLQERAEHLAALVADVAHHLELLVDHHEELVDLLLIRQEVGQLPLEIVGDLLRGTLEIARQPEGARDRVHPDVAAVHAHVPLGRGADQVAIAGEEAVGPVRPALALQKTTQHGERAVMVPVVELGPVVAADHEVGALALADLVLDDGLDQVGVGVVVHVEPAAVGELHGDVGQRLDHLGDGELPLALDVDDHQRGAVVVGLEAPLADLPERHREQPVGHLAGLRGALLERYVEQRLDHRPGACQHADRVPITRPRGTPDDRPRLVPRDLLDRGLGRAVGRHGMSLIVARPGNAFDSDAGPRATARCPRSVDSA